MHANELQRFGGLLTKDEEAARPGLAREAERLRQEITSLTSQSGDLSERVDGPDGDRIVRRQAEAFLVALRQQRDEEADVKLESVTTDIGVGD